MRAGFLSFGRLSSSAADKEEETAANLPDHDEDTQDLARNKRKLPKRVRCR
jgi:hypothetical protein